MHLNSMQLQKPPLNFPQSTKSHSYLKYMNTSLNTNNIISDKNAYNSGMNYNVMGNGNVYSMPDHEHEHEHEGERDRGQLWDAGHIQINGFDSLETKCRKLEEINENLKYNNCLLETQLEVLKKLQKQKTQQSKKAKQKIKSKLQKQNQIKRHLKLQKQKIKKLLNGYRHLCHEHNEQLKKQQKRRQQRLNTQQKKNQIYQYYNSLELQYKTTLHKIKDLEPVVAQFDNVREQNAKIKEEIGEIHQLLGEEQTSREDVIVLKKERNLKVKELNQKVGDLDKQEKCIRVQLDEIQRSLLTWQHQKNKIQQKSAQQLSLYQKLQSAKSYLTSKKAQFTELDSAYKQFCLQQTRMKKQIILQRQCSEARRKYKESLRMGMGARPMSSPKSKIVGDGPGLNKTYGGGNLYGNQASFREGGFEKDGERQEKGGKGDMSKLYNLIRKFENVNNKNKR